jgi:large subunit ribosomal protein L30
VARLSVTLVKSGIGYKEDQKRTLKALGLRRMNQSVEHEDSAAIRGMINKVRHLVTVEAIG